MAGPRKVYTPEFKLQAVQMITDQRLSVAEVARRLGDDAGVHHGGGGIAVFMAEVRADQAAALDTDHLGAQSQLGFDFGKPVVEHLFDLPVPVLEIAEHDTQLCTHCSGIERQYIGCQLLYALEVRS